MYGWMEGGREEWREGWMDRGMVEWIDGWGWMDGQVDG
jgi:hypothetical protein